MRSHARWIPFGLVFVLVGSLAFADFYVVPVVKKNFVPAQKTGQDECYVSETPWEGEPCTCGSENCPSGQDGDLKKGAAWPNPRFTDKGNGTVKDNLTDLIWTKITNCAYVNWEEALNYCNSLSDQGGAECGLTDGSQPGDWRLPNVRELQSLIHYGYSAPAVPDTAGTGQWSAGDPFTNVQLSWYWTSSTYLDDKQNAWSVFLRAGQVYFNFKNSSQVAWCVRGGR